MLNPDKVLKEVNEIRDKRNKWDNGEYLRGKTIEEFSIVMEQEYDYLFKNAGTLFKKCIDNDIDMIRLREMLSYLRQIQTGKSEETVTRQVGELLANRYVKPIVDKLDKDKENK